MLFIPWLILYEYVVYRGPQPGAFSTYLPGELHWPIWQWTEVLYLSPYVLVTLVPLVTQKNRVLRRFTVAGLLATALVMGIFLTVPALAVPRPFEPQGWLGEMMMTDRMLDLNNGTAACPSFHVVWALLGGAAYAALFPRWRWVCWGWSAAVGASCVFTGMHSLIDVLLGGAVFALTYNYAALWQRVPRIRQLASVPVRPDEPDD
jgi:membrane-associated phospholipid phosphatase